MCGIFFFSTIAKASTSNYLVKVIHGKNQVSLNVPYFDIRVKKNEKTQLALEVQNLEKNTIEVMVEPCNAGTNSNGLITYNTTPIEDNSLKHPFTKLVNEKKLVNMAPLETKIVKFDLNMPPEEFDGMILGGFRIYEINEKKNETFQFEINNKVEYQISVKITENNIEIKPNLNVLNIQLDENKSNIIETIQNDKSNIIQNLSIETSIYKKRNMSTPVIVDKRNKLKMAPNSTMELLIDVEDKIFNDGDYIAKIKANDSEGNHWVLEKTFSIKHKEDLYGTSLGIVTYNKIEKETKKTLILAIIFIMIFLFLLIMGNILLNKIYKRR